ncbi:MAG: carbon storage regulator, partial [Thermoguttaceae bacterium]
RSRETEICIGSDITIRVLAIHKSQVTLGIEAPGTVRIRRQEVVPIRQGAEPAGVQPFSRSQESCLRE